MPSVSTPKHDKSRSRLEAELLHELFRRGRRSTPVLIFLVLTLGLVARPEIESARLTRWSYFVVLTLAVGRAAFFARGYRLLKGRSTKTKYAWTGAMAAAISVAFAILNISVFDRLDAVRLALWFLTVSGILSGAVASLGGSPFIYACYTIANLGSIIAMPLFTTRAGGSSFSLLMGALGVFLAAQVVDTARTWRERVLLSIELKEKMAELEAKQVESVRQNEALERKNAELLQLHERANRIFSALTDALPGRLIDGKYLLGERIGSGGFAVVFRGEHMSLKRPVAIKVFRPQPGNDSSVALERFLKEGEATSRLSHPSIVEIFDAGVSRDGLAYIAMELLVGETLEDILQKERSLSLEATCLLATQLSGALDEAHRAGIIHRDVKPENVFVASASVVTAKLLDFGVARVREAVGRDTEAMTQSGSLLGSPKYMAPERFFEGDYDERVDVYSLGVVLYRCLAGRLPFEGTLAELVGKTINEAPPALTVVAPTTPRDVAAIVVRMLCPQPEGRPTAQQVHQFFRRYSVSQPEGKMYS